MPSSVLYSDAPPADMDGQDPYVDLALTSCPGDEGGVFSQMTELAGLCDTVRRPAHEHAPPLAKGLVDAVDFERYVVGGVRRDQRSAAGPEHDRVRDHDIVDRQHHQARGRGDSDPADTARLDQ